MEALVLAGGRGTRMGSLTDTLPKPMLEVAGWPLIAHQLNRLAAAGITRAVLATGWRAEAFAALADLDLGLEVAVVTEDRPLGTAGAVGFAAGALRSEADEVVLVANGDLLSGHDLAAQVAALRARPDWELVLHVRLVADASAYGSVVVDDDGTVLAFVEKCPDPPSLLVSAGTYAVRAGTLHALDGTRESSMELEVFPALVERGAVGAYDEVAYFRDVGTPAALAEAAADVRAGLVPGALPAR